MKDLNSSFADATSKTSEEPIFSLMIPSMVMYLTSMLDRCISCWVFFHSEGRETKQLHWEGWLPVLKEHQKMEGNCTLDYPIWWRLCWSSVHLDTNALAPLPIVREEGSWCAERQSKFRLHPKFKSACAVCHGCFPSWSMAKAVLDTSVKVSRHLSQGV